MRERSDNSTQRERGAVLFWVAGTLVALMAAAALAVDLGWIYLNHQRLQRAADAAALAGAVYAPFLPPADTAAGQAATANGYPDSEADLAGAIIGGDKYRATLSNVRVPLFIAPVIGVDSIEIAATSTAQYIPEVPVGSPYQCFGGIPGPGGLPTGMSAAGCPDRQFAAAIKAERTPKTYGDAFNVVCTSTSSTAACAGSNSEHQRPQSGGWGGYYYAVEVPASASSIRVQVYDARAYAPAAGQTYTPVGDFSFSDTTLPTTHYTLKAPNTSAPWDPNQASAVSGCTLNAAPGGQLPSANPPAGTPTGYATWTNVCSGAGGSVSVTGGVTYFLHVTTSGNVSGASASNSYSISVTSNAGTPRVYAVRDMSIFIGQPTATSGGFNDILTLAEVDEVHAGKTLILEFFDAGDVGAGGHANYQMRMPNGSGGTMPYDSHPEADCSWVAYEQNHVTPVTGSDGSGSSCTINAANRFNNRWLVVTIRIPGNYTCGSWCWWEMDMQMSQPTESTTWTARVIGNPVRLIENP